MLNNEYSSLPVLEMYMQDANLCHAFQNQPSKSSMLQYIVVL